MEKSKLEIKMRWLRWQAFHSGFRDLNSLMEADKEEVTLSKQLPRKSENEIKVPKSFLPYPQKRIFGCVWDLFYSDKQQCMPKKNGHLKKYKRLTLLSGM